MPQTIKATATIELPPNFKIVNTDQLGNDESLLGKTWNYDDLRGWLGNKSRTWIEENILYNPKYSREIQSMYDQRLIIKSSGKGSPWKFKALEMAKFLDKHWTEFDWRASK